MRNPMSDMKPVMCMQIFFKMLLFSVVSGLFFLQLLFGATVYAESGIDELQNQPARHSECLPGVQYKRNDQGQCLPVQQEKVTDKFQKALIEKPEPECVIVKGQASRVEVDTEFAKKMAIREALKNATMQRSLKVNSDITMQNQELTLETSRFVSSSHVKSYTLLSEGLEDPQDIYGQPKPRPLNYEVELEVCLSSARGICPDLNGRKYYPRLLIAPLAVEDRAGARDIRNLVFGYQEELERRLLNAGQKNLDKLNQVVDLQINQHVSPNLDSELIEEVYSNTGAQYVLLSVLRSVGSQLEESGLGTRIKRYYNHAVEDNSRYIEADWYLVNLLSKRVVHQARGGFDIKGKVRVGRERPFATNAFFATDTGRAFDVLLNQEVENVLDFMHCQRFESEVIDVRDGKYYLYLNPDVGVQVGDDLAVYQRVGMPLNFSGQNLGSEYKPGAFLKVTEIYAKFAVAELITQKNLVQIGDRVRPW